MLFFNFNNWDSLQIIPATPQLDRSHSTSKAKQDLRTLLESSKCWLEIHLPLLLLGHHLSMEGIWEDSWEQPTSGDEIPYPGALLDELQEQVSQCSIFSSSKRGTQPVRKQCRGMPLEAPPLWFNRAAAAQRFKPTLRIWSVHPRLSTVADSTGGSGVTMLASDYKHEKDLLGWYNYGERKRTRWAIRPSLSFYSDCINFQLR